jgi:site-specific recombinase XerC
MRTFRIGVLSALEHSLFETKLGHTVRNYLISCRADGKSPDTIRTYGQVLKALLKFYRDMGLKPEPKKIEASDVRLFFLSLQERGDS